MLSVIDPEMRGSGARGADWVMASPDGFRAQNPMSAELGFTPLELRSEDGFARIRYEPQAKHTNFSGAVHGGVITTMIDDCAGMAASILVGSAFRGTLGITVQFMDRVLPGEYVARAQVTGCSKTLIFVEASLQDLSGAIKVSALATCAYGAAKK